METHDQLARPARVLRSPTRPGWIVEIHEDSVAVWREKEYMKYLHLTPAQRIAEAEALRRSFYGERYASTRLRGPVELLERPWG